MKRIKKTVIILGYKCNNNCIFCIYQEKDRQTFRSTSQIKREILLAKSRGRNYLEFIGGETTIKEDFLEILRFSKKVGFETIHVTTNGRMFAYPEYAKKFIEAGITSLVFSIHGHEAKVHDNLTRVPGSFEQMLKGVENVKKLGFNNIGSNTTITRKNYKHLKEIGDFIANLGIKNSEFIFVDPNQGGARVNFKKLVPKISKAAPFIRKCLAIGKKNKFPHWHIRYVPLCYFQDYLDQISEIEEVKMFHSEHIAPDFVNLNAEKARSEVGRVKGPQCRGCSLDGICEGIWKKYAEEYGFQELIPLKNKVFS